MGWQITCDFTSCCFLLFYIEHVVLYNQIFHKLKPNEYILSFALFGTESEMDCVRAVYIKFNLSEPVIWNFLASRARPAESLALNSMGGPGTLFLYFFLFSTCTVYGVAQKKAHLFIFIVAPPLTPPPSPLHK